MSFRSLSTFLLLAAFPLAHSFQFSVGKVSQCDDLNVSWSGGSPPFQLLITPVFGTPRNISIPTSAQGSFATIMPFPKGQQLVITMSDATGFGTGGTTNLTIVGDPVTGTACNTADPGVPFTFELNSALQQCRPFTFSGYTGAIHPVTIIGLIPSGQSVVLRPPLGSPTFDWVANAAAGTSMIFLMADSQGRQGGSSRVETVAVTEDRACLSGQALSSTFSSSAAISTTGSSTTPTSATVITSASSTTSATAAAAARASPRVSVPTIVGAIVGGIVAVAAMVTLSFFFCIRRRANRAEGGGGESQKRFSRRLGSLDNTREIDEGASTISPYQYTNTTSEAALSSAPDDTEFNPYLLHPPPPVHLSPTQSSLYDPPHSPTSAEGETSTSSIPARSKAALAEETSPKPTRFVLHTDLDDTVHPNSDGVVELPPQYSDRRASQSVAPFLNLPQHPPVLLPQLYSQSGSRSSVHLPYLAD